MRGGGKGTALLVLVVALLCYSACVILARVVYGHGGNALTVLISRMGVFFTFLWIYFAVTGRSVEISARDRWASLGIGLVVAVQSYAYYSAFEYIPVSLAALIFYTYPTLVAIASRLVSRAPLTPLMLAALIAAFFGLALVLEASIDDVEPHGLVRAAISSIGMTATVMIASRVLARVDAQLMTFYSSGVTSLVYILVAFATGWAATPVDFPGWAALIAIPFVYTFGVLGWYSTMPLLGAVRVTFLSNFEPLFTVALAALLLGEILTLRQMLGAALVIGAVLALQIFGRRGA